MPITADQRTDRRQVIGSSDSPAILNVDPHRSALAVWATKVFAVMEDSDSEPAELGNDFERPMLLWAARKLGVEIEENVTTRSASGPFASNHDALVVGRPWGFEAKLRMIDNPEEWGDEEAEDGERSDLVPAAVVVQCQHQMYTGGLERVYVPAFMSVRGRLRRRLYCVKRSELLIAEIIRAGLEFWNMYVVPRVPPPATVPEVHVFKRIVRETGKVAKISANVVELWEGLRDARMAAKKAEDLAFTRVLAEIGDADAFEWGAPDGAYYTYSEYAQSRLDIERLRSERPAIAEMFSKEISMRKAYRRTPGKKKGGRR